jgi:hypothetical protein
LPPMALPMRTISTVSRERRRVVLSLFIVSTSDYGVIAGGNKKTFTPGINAWIKVLLAGVCPGSGSCDRIDGIRVGLFCGR